MKNFEIVYANEVERFRREHHAILVDIREHREYEKEHWPGAVNMPYDEVTDSVKKMPQNRYLLLYCDHGGGSMQLASRLGREGYLTATVVGGYEAMKKVRKNYFKNPEDV